MAEKKYYGMYQGIVTTNADPEKRGRLKVKCPTVLGAETESAWCDPVVPVAYDHGGDFCIPARDEAVWLQFIEGDANKPVWLGGWWQKSMTPLGENYANVDKVRIIQYADCTITMQNGIININVGAGVCDLKIENSKVSVVGNLSVTGSISSGSLTTGSVSATSVTASESVTANGISLSEHTHGGVTSGGDDTSEPK